MTAQAYEADRALVARVLANDPRAYEELSVRLAPVIDGRLARARARYPAIAGSADDLRQELMMALLDDNCAVLRTYEGRSALSTWIYAIATRFFFRRGRREDHRAQRISTEEPAEQLGSGEASPELQALRGEQIRGVRSALAELEQDEQLMLKMLYESDASSETVGRVLGISDAGVRMKKRRLLAKLARVLEGLWP
jgi:RNA polymerase sigma-70 factor, ECF subfamily